MHISAFITHQYFRDLIPFIMDSPHPLSAGAVESPTKISKRGDLIGPQLLEGDCWERGDNFFQGGLQFSHKSKLKSEIFNDKNSLQAKIFFSVITKSSNWEILPKI